MFLVNLANHGALLTITQSWIDSNILPNQKSDHTASLRKYIRRFDQAGKCEWFLVIPCMRCSPWSKKKVIKHQKVRRMNEEKIGCVNPLAHGKLKFVRVSWDICNGYNAEAPADRSRFKPHGSGSVPRKSHSWPERWPQYDRTYCESMSGIQTLVPKRSQVFSAQ